MILAYNFYDLIDDEAKIYRGNSSILNLLSDISNSDKFEKAKNVVQNSLIFNQTLKSKFENFEDFKNNKDAYIKRIRIYSPFSQGKYIVLAVMKLILDKCNYLDKFLNTETFLNKNFLFENVLKYWLIIILDKLLIPEYENFNKNIGSSLSAFYLRTQTYENIKEKFNCLDIDLDKEYKNIFPISF